VLKTIARSLAVLILAALCPLAALAQQPGALAQYVVTLNGINVAYLNIRLNIEGGSYQLDLSANVIGLAQIVAQGSGAVNSGGRVTSNGLASDRFYLETRTSSDRFSVETRYAGGTANHFVVSPPLPENPDRVPVTSAHRRGVNDPVAAFILRGPALDQSLCNRTMPVFTGIERFDLQFSFVQMDSATSSRTGYQGPVVACAMRYVPISGHFNSSEITAYLRDNQRMMAWFSPLGESGFFIPYRVLMGTSFGDLSLVLTSIDR
jgi:hypothetical protein